jgi:hypothetical protein
MNLNERKAAQVVGVGALTTTTKRMRCLEAASLVLVFTLEGCAGLPSPTAAAPNPSPCPDDLRDSISLDLSAAPVSLPLGTSVEEGAVHRDGIVARRINVAVTPKGAARKVLITDSSLTITPAGATFNGWVAVEDAGKKESRAVSSIPGRVRITPFLTVGAFTPFTLAIDAVLMTGGMPVDTPVVVTPNLWGTDGKARLPGELDVQFTTIRVASVYDNVMGTAKLEYVALKSKSPRAARWSCSLESTARLVDADATRPALWDIGTPRRGGQRVRWLALFDQKTGPIRALFTNSETARGFTNWVREVRAQRIGKYELGTFTPDPEDASEDGSGHVPLDRTITSSYHPITEDELGGLRAGPLGKP